MKKLLFTVLILMAFFIVPTNAQEPKIPSDMKALVDLSKEQKRLAVKRNMNLSPAEAKDFWPIYDAYQADLEIINKKLFKLIVRYAEGYRNNTLTDDSALAILREAQDIESAEIELEKSYEKKLQTVFSGKKVARYLQIERKVRAALRYGLAKNIPLVK